VAVRDGAAERFRAETVQAVWDASASAVEYAAFATKELGGTTADIVFNVVIEGGDVVLNVVNSGTDNGWNVRAKRILI
jgi:hypothetical protein